MAAIGFLVMLIGAIGSVYWKFGGAVGKVRDDLSAHKLHVAETYATKAGTSEQMLALGDAVKAVGDRVERGLDGVNKRFDGMNERLDRVIEANHKPVRRTGG